VRTRVGYTGGEKVDPTYRALGDHTEAFEVDFDPEVLSYAELLELFWKSHNPCARPWSRQYRSAVFYHDETQRKLAEESAARIASERGAPVQTLIEQVDRFYLAEDYHQKYRLRRHVDLAGELLEIYPALEDFVNSTAATRLNGYLAGYGSRADLERDLPRLGLSEDAQARLLAGFSGSE